MSDYSETIILKLNDHEKCFLRSNVLRDNASYVTVTAKRFSEILNSRKLREGNIDELASHTSNKAVEVHVKCLRAEVNLQLTKSNLN